MKNNALANWIDVLEQQSIIHPNKIVLIEQSNQVSYQELAQKAKSLAALISKETSFGDRVIILMPNSIDYIVSFFACIYAGVIAVNAYTPNNKKRDWPRLNAIINDCQPKIALHLAESQQKMSLWQSQHQHSFKNIVIDEVNLPEPEQWQKPIIKSHDIAYLQYSSGSTGQPKGVMLSHANLLHNTQLITNHYEFNQYDKIINWLPLYHDMGFVGGVLSPIRNGAEICLVSSATVAQDPVKLFELITANRSTVTASPNFVFDLAVKRITPEQKQQLDLSSLRVFVNGAEPINADTLQQFNQYFADANLSPNVVKPSYGMAEACLLVTSTPLNEAYCTLRLNQEKLLLGKVIEDIKGKDLACSGILIEGLTVKIVHAETRIELPDGYIGEIMIKSDSISQGYWQKETLNGKTFNQSVNSETGYMASGDLGFIVKGRLYVSGRKKEMFVINGRNYYPQDIEYSLLNLSDNLMPHGAAVFEVPTGINTAELVLVQELTRQGMRHPDHQELINEIREIISQTHELKLAAVILIKPASLAKTSSGKIQRVACRQAYMQQQLKAVTSWYQPSSSDNTLQNLAPLTSFDQKRIEEWIIYWLAQRLSVSTNQLSPEHQLAQLGLDSIDAMTLTHELSKQLSLELNIEVSWSYPNIAALSHFLSEQKRSKGKDDLKTETPTEGII
mgnify:CR=1 FL=1